MSRQALYSLRPGVTLWSCNTCWSAYTNCARWPRRPGNPLRPYFACIPFCALRPAGNHECQLRMCFAPGVQHGSVAVRLPCDGAQNLDIGVFARQALQPLRACGAGRSRWSMRSRLALGTGRPNGPHGTGCAPEILTAIRRLGKKRTVRRRTRIKPRMRIMMIRQTQFLPTYVSYTFMAIIFRHRRNRAGLGEFILRGALMKRKITPAYFYEGVESEFVILCFMATVFFCAASRFH